MNRRAFGSMAFGTVATGVIMACTTTTSTATPQVAPQPATPQVPPTYITIYVSDMHCGGCCQKVSSKLYTIQGVIKVQTNLQKHMAIVVPKPGTELSPRKLWEAIEQVEMKPVKLVTAKQIFTEKPPQTVSR